MKSTQLTRLAINVVILLSIALGYFFYRSSVGFVWDDSRHIVANKFDVNSSLIWGQENLLRDIIVKSFGKVSFTGYRPLSTLIDSSAKAVFTADNSYKNVWFFGVGLILGFLALATYAVGRRYLKTLTGAIITVLIYIFSTPVITASWIVFSGIQALVPLFICCGLLLYWKIRQTDKCKPFRMLLLYLIFLLGPWYREFIGILPILVIFLELKRYRCPTTLSTVSVLFFLHSLFPTLIIKALFFRDLPLRPVFSLGLLGTQLGQADGGSVFAFYENLVNSVRLAVPLHFLTLFPPVLIAAISFDYLLFHMKKISAIWPKPSRCFLSSYLAVGKEAFLPVTYFALLLLGVLKVINPEHFGLLLCAVFALQGLRRDSFLFV